MHYIILGAILAFIITFFSIPVIIQIAKSKKLFDEPDERKVHKTVIPTLGGVGIFDFVFALPISCFNRHHNGEYPIGAGRFSHRIMDVGATLIGGRFSWLYYVGRHCDSQRDSEGIALHQFM